MKSIFVIMLLGFVSLPSLASGFQGSGSTLNQEDMDAAPPKATPAFSIESTEQEREFNIDDLEASINNFVLTPKGGVSWTVFSKTKQIPYSYKDPEGMEWSGVKPEFPDALKALAGKDILIQGYMFPLGQEEKQDIFLLGPFPLSCPFHYHSPPNLIIEAHAKTPADFSYDAINVKGKLELVSSDDDYNVFYRLNDAEVMP